LGGDTIPQSSFFRRRNQGTGPEYQKKIGGIQKKGVQLSMLYPIAARPFWAYVLIIFRVIEEKEYGKRGNTRVGC
jgi:hypothetical protein